MAGLLAARVLASYFARVTIVERDTFPTQPGLRKGVPQARHIHALLARGARVLEELFPGFLDELSAAGATTLEWGFDNPTYNMGRWMLRRHTGLFSRMSSRALLEFMVRRRVAALGNVDFLEQREAIGLLANATRSAVTGLRTRPRGQPTAEGDTLLADLVVEASGRSSHAPEWLVAIGYAAPAETNIDSFIGYATRHYRPPANYTADWKALTLRGKPPNINRVGGYFSIEGGRWIVTMMGFGRADPPLDEAGFSEFARTLGDPPLLAEALREAEPLGPAVGFQRAANRWRHYERLECWPDNFMVVGDAACAFNPIYGQGMSVAGLEALVLDRCLRPVAQGHRERVGLAHRFQQAQARELATPWQLATIEDYRIPQTEGPTPSFGLHVMHAYIDRVAIASSHSPLVWQAFTEVAQLISPPSVLFSPAIVARVLWANRPGTTKPQPGQGPAPAG